MPYRSYLRMHIKPHLWKGLRETRLQMLPYPSPHPYFPLAHPLLISCIRHLSHFTMRSIESQNRRNGRKSRRIARKKSEIFKKFSENFWKNSESFQKISEFFLIPHISSSASSEIVDNLMPKIRIELREEARRERRKSLSLQLWTTHYSPVL